MDRQNSQAGMSMNGGGSVANSAQPSQLGTMGTHEGYDSIGSSGDAFGNAFAQKYAMMDDKIGIDQQNANTSLLDAQTGRMNAGTGQFNAMTDRMGAGTNQYGAETARMGADTNQFKANSSRASARSARNDTRPSFSSSPGGGRAGLRSSSSTGGGRAGSGSNRLSRLGTGGGSSFSRGGFSSAS